MTVPYTFATATGNIPLSHLDANFSNVKNASYTAATVTTAAQPNITSVGTLSSLTVSGNVTASNFIGTISGNIANAVYATTSGTVTTNAQPNITSVGTLSSLTVSGNITGSNVSGTHYGSGAGLTSLPGGNVSGAVANATYATNAGTVTTNAQPNITSVGTLSSLTVSGNITGGNLLTAGQIISSIVTGTAPMIVQSTTQVANLNVATAGTVTTAAQPNITSVGTLSSLTVSGNITGNSKTSTKTLETYKLALGTVSGAVAIDVSAGDVQTFTTSGNVTLSFTNWGASGMSSSVTLIIDVASASHRVTGPLGIVNSFGVIGLDYPTGVMSFPIAGTYSFTFSSVDGGSTISLTENNVLLRPYNSTSEAITSTSNALISLGVTYSTYYPSPISTTGTAYLANGVAGQIKVVGSLGTSAWTVAVPGSSWGGSNQINFDAAGQNITLVWSNPLSVWLILNSHGNVTVS